MDETVLLGHGSGGSMMKRIIDEVFFEAYAGEELRAGDDAARLEAPEGERVAFSTDSFVVTPQFFPGGDIGRLAVCSSLKRAIRWISSNAFARAWPRWPKKQACAS